LESNASFSFTISFNPLQPGFYQALLTITDTLPGRALASKRLNHTISLSGTGLRGIRVGTANEIARMPVAMNYRNSLYETIFQGSELSGLSGYLTGLRWKYRFLEELLQKPIKIWLGSTTSDNLIAGWIPSTQLSLVYDGQQDFIPGIHDLEITFDTPYLYPGGNLVMMVQRPMDTQYFSMHNQFFCTTVGTNRSRKIQSDTQTYNPASPADTGVNPTGQFPNTTFLYSDSLFVSVSGRVVTADHTTGIPGASVSLTGATNYQVLTSADGSFSFAAVVPNTTYQYTIAATDYNPFSGNIQVGYADCQMGDLPLDDIPYPPSDAVATMDP
ncbi:MAG TPA: carboxypeptidase-like regulatory domain-containing protein, partial [Candidatus Cloacimonadota bacterium]|nr:carboxypeptidase-like regulatory domain-containing protein [Candidatus Cloacimonadota bacterium]